MQTTGSEALDNYSKIYLNSNKFKNLFIKNTEEALKIRFNHYEVLRHTDGNSFVVELHDLSLLIQIKEEKVNYFVIIVDDGESGAVNLEGERIINVEQQSSFDFDKFCTYLNAELEKKLR